MFGNIANNTIRRRRSLPCRNLKMRHRSTATATHAVAAAVATVLPLACVFAKRCNARSFRANVSMRKHHIDIDMLCTSSSRLCMCVCMRPYLDRVCVRLISDHSTILHTHNGRYTACMTCSCANARAECAMMMSTQSEKEKNIYALWAILIPH